MTRRAYAYVGPASIPTHDGQPQGLAIETREDLELALEELGTPKRGILTFVVNRAGVLLIADRHSEHVNCAGGQSVLSAGEITIERLPSGLEVTEVTNQSTGYCPKPSSWDAVAAAIPEGVAKPDYWTAEFTFRRCRQCLGINIVKEDYFFCGVCDAPLPEEWNFGG